MLHLDDELAGLIESADMPADQHAAHSTRPVPAASVPGEGSLVRITMTALSALRCAVQCPEVVLQCNMARSDAVLSNVLSLCCNVT